MQVFRDLGIEGDVIEKATPHHLMGDTVFCTSLAGEELARLHTWGTHPARLADYTLASPTTPVDIPQTLLEPILVNHAAARGAKFRFNTEYLSLEQDGDGVTATVLDRDLGQGVDAPRAVPDRRRRRPQQGRRATSACRWRARWTSPGSMNIVLEADLSRYVAHRPSILYWVLQPGSRIGGIGMGLVRIVRPWDEWLLVWGYDISGPPPEMNDEKAISIARSLIGDETIPIRIKSYSLWGNNKMYATRYATGRVFCMGDAVHRHPPSNGLGSNTSIQDAYNLAWKLALVLRGQAGPSLLESYDDERAPIGKQIVLRANKSIEEFGPIFASLGLLDSADPRQMQANMDGAQGRHARGPREAAPASSRRSS